MYNYKHLYIWLTVISWSVCVSSFFVFRAAVKFLCTGIEFMLSMITFHTPFICCFDKIYNYIIIYNYIMLYYIIYIYYNNYKTLVVYTYINIGSTGTKLSTYIIHDFVQYNILIYIIYSN